MAWHFRFQAVASLCDDWGVLLGTCKSEIELYKQAICQVLDRPNTRRLYLSGNVDYLGSFSFGFLSLLFCHPSSFFMPHSPPSLPFPFNLVLWLNLSTFIVYGEYRYISCSPIVRAQHPIIWGPCDGGQTWTLFWFLKIIAADASRKKVSDAVLKITPAFKCLINEDVSDAKNLKASM